MSVKVIPGRWAKVPKEWEFPDFQIDELHSKINPFCVVVFVVNEGDKVRQQLSEMTAIAKQIDIIIADGGSTDGSLELKFLRSCRVRCLLTKMGPGKLSAQMRMAFAYALSEEYLGVVVIDGNNKDDTTAIPRFIASLVAGNDHVQGSRFIPGGKAINTPFLRLLGLHMLHAPLISLAAGFRYTDTTNGFRAYSSRLLRDPRLAVFRNVFMQYELHYYLAIESARLGFRITEIPVTRAYPPGKVPTKISGLKGNWLIIKTLFLAVLRRYSPKHLG